VCFIVFTSHSLDHFVGQEDAGMKNCSRIKEVVERRVTFAGAVLAYNSCPPGVGGLSCLRVKWLGRGAGGGCLRNVCKLALSSPRHKTDELHPTS
jgi:hypothetical protein